MVYRIREGFQVSETGSKVIYESYLDFMEFYKIVSNIIKRWINIHMVTKVSSFIRAVNYRNIELA